MFKLGDWLVDPATRQLSRETEQGSDRVRLVPKAMAVLVALHEAGGQVLSREALMEAVWPEVTVGEEVLTRAIADLRKALGDSRQQPRYIQTVQKTGYRLLMDESAVAEPIRLPAPQTDVEQTEGNRRSLYGQPSPARPSYAFSQLALSEDQTPDARPSIAVLAFNNMSYDPEQEYFADGMSEDIITDLSRFSSLAIIARHSSFSYKGKAVTVQEVGRELGVDYVVEGSLRRAGKALRVSAQLVDATSGHHIWAERYDRDLDDIFAVQDELVRDIVSALRQQIDHLGLQRAQRKGTENLSAYEYVLHGRAHYDKMTAAGDLAALECFRRAVELDPKYALAHVYIARVYMDVFLFGWSKKPDEALTQALETAQTAVALDGTDSFARAALASIHVYKRQFSRAELQFDKALSLNPNDADTLAIRAFFAESLGDADAALTWMGKALRLNPFAPDWYIWHCARAYYLARRYEDALASVNEMESPPYEILGLAAACHARLGQQAAAGRALQRFHHLAQGELAYYPGEDAEGWRRYWSNTFPYREARDLEHLFEGLRLAGLPL